MGDLQRQRDFIAANTAKINLKYRYQRENATQVIRTVEKKRQSDKAWFLSPELKGKHDNPPKVAIKIKEGMRRLEFLKFAVICRARTSKESIDGGKTAADLYRDYQELCVKEKIEYGNYPMRYLIMSFIWGFFPTSKGETFRRGQKMKEQIIH
ncbi:hypothetical protein TNCV_4151281 [Trichonephila clavipes]|nr:hypothetical protein TNCV_4151281 [Trichonephila clavipes]